MKIFRYVLDRAPLDVVLSYNHYTLQNTMLGDLVPYLKSKGVGIMNAAPFSARLLTNEPLPRWHKATDAVRAACRRAAEHCQSRGVDIAQLALQFSIRNPDLATCITGTANPARIRQWAAWAETPIDESLLAEVLEILRPIHNWHYIEGRTENNDPYAHTSPKRQRGSAASPPSLTLRACAGAALKNPMLIDAHHHFWKYDPAQYSWIDDAKARLRCDFLPQHLAAEIAAAGIDGVVSVQARQTIEETRWLLELAERNDFIRGVVGWVPLISRRLADELGLLAEHAKLKAVRHVLQDEPDPDYMLRADFDNGISNLADFGLAYDILIFERHLPQAIRLVDRHPAQVFVLDHIAKPRIGEGILSPWRENMRELARRANVYCKISGMATEADWQHWSSAQLRPYCDVVLEAFGPRRLMFGSDWPVCLLACDYRRWKDVVREFIASLSAAEQACIMGQTAIEAYRLK